MTVIKSINGQVSVSNHYLQQVDQYWISEMFVTLNVSLYLRI